MSNHLLFLLYDADEVSAWAGSCTGGRHDYRGPLPRSWADYWPVADVSAATATMDLVAAGLLRAVGRGRSRSYQAGAILYEKI